MTREDIIRMAREANIKQAIETPHLLMVHELERFAALVAAAEREVCAKALKAMNEKLRLTAAKNESRQSDIAFGRMLAFDEAAAAIRARGNA